MKKGTDEHWPNPFGHGVLYVREMRSGGRWLWTSIHGTQRATGIRWPDSPTTRKEAKRRGMEILIDRVEGRENPVRKMERPSLFGAIEVFQEATFPRVSKNVRAVYRHMFDHCFYRSLPKDVPIDYDTILTHLESAVPRIALGPERTIKVLQKLRAFLEYLVGRDWLTKSPMLALGGVPRRPEMKEENRIWEMPELEKMVEWCRANDPPLGMLLRFACRVGIRPGEATRLRWSDITDTAIRIESKLPSVKRKLAASKVERPERWFPIVDSRGREWIPGLRAIIEEMRAGNEYVFPWRTEPALAKAHLRCRVAVGLDDGRTVRHLRKTAIHLWEHTLGLPVDVRVDLAGHSLAVQTRNYRRKPRADELARKVDIARRKSIIPV